MIIPADERAELGSYSQCDVCAISTIDPLYPNGQKYLISNTQRMYGVRFAQGLNSRVTLAADIELRPVPAQGAPI